MSENFSNKNHGEGENLSSALHVKGTHKHIYSPRLGAISKLQKFNGLIKPSLYSSMKLTDTKEPSLSLSREMSLEKVDEKQEGVSDRYLSLRRSIKDMQEDIKLPKQKSTFKIRKHHSGGRKLRLTINTKF